MRREHCKRGVEPSSESQHGSCTPIDKQAHHSTHLRQWPEWWLHSRIAAASQPAPALAGFPHQQASLGDTCTVMGSPVCWMLYSNCAFHNTNATPLTLSSAHRAVQAFRPGSADLLTEQIALNAAPSTLQQVASGAASDRCRGAAGGGTHLQRRRTPPPSRPWCAEVQPRAPSRRETPPPGNRRNRRDKPEARKWRAGGRRDALCGP